MNPSESLPETTSAPATPAIPPAAPTTPAAEQATPDGEIKPVATVMTATTESPVSNGSTPPTPAPADKAASKTSEKPPLPDPKPRVPEHDLLVEGCLKVTGHDGVVLDFPLQIQLHRALSPSFITLAQQQFETVINDLLVRPATIALIAHIESVQATRKAEKLQAAKSATRDSRPPLMSDILGPNAELGKVTPEN